MKNQFPILSVFLLAAFTILLSGCQKKQEMGNGLPFTIEVFAVDPAPLNKAFKIVTPKPGEVVGDDVEIYFSAAGFDISEDRFHLHFILDDGEVIEHTDSNSPVKLENLSNGPHIVRAFAVDENHLSIKSSRTFDMVQFYVKEAVGNMHIDNSAPMLLLNVPSGTYDLGESESVKFDFWLSNAQLGIFDYKVKYSLDGHEGEFELWKAFEIKNLSKGKHKLILDLIDPNGKPVLGNFNHTIRTFVVK